MLQNAYLVAKIGADTAEDEQHFAEILPKISAKCEVREPWRRALARAPPSRRAAAPAPPWGPADAAAAADAE